MTNKKKGVTCFNHVFEPDPFIFFQEINLRLVKRLFFFLRIQPLCVEWQNRNKSFERVRQKTKVDSLGASLHNLPQNRVYHITDTL